MWQYVAAVAVLVSVCASEPAHAQLNKCTINGKVSYTDGGCPKGARQDAVRPPEPRGTSPGPRAPVAAGNADPSSFASRLYDVSVYTDEDAVFKALVAAEVDLAASRWLAKKMSVSDPATRSRVPSNWGDLLGHMRKVLAPVVDQHLRDRANALRVAGLEGRAPYVEEYQKVLQGGIRRPDMRFADGSTSNDGGSSQAGDMREILAFHNTAAASKWRSLWPDLRVYGAQMAALEYRVMADQGLGPSNDWNERARALMQKVGGRVVAPGEWQALGNERLAFTMTGLSRFVLPLGTEMRVNASDTSQTTIAERGPSVVVTQMDGPRMNYRVLDSRWSGDFMRRLTPAELKQIDDALTASWVEAKGRWFAPLELEFEGYMAVAKRLRTSKEMRQVYQSFNDRSAEAMARAWEGWQRK